MGVLWTLLVLGMLCAAGEPSPQQVTFPILSSVRNIVQRLTNTTIGVVRGGINAMGGTILRIVNRVGQATDKVVDLLEEIRKYMPFGIPELGLPRLEPLLIDKFDFVVEHPAVDLDCKLRNLEIRQLSTFEIMDIGISLPNVTLNVSFPYLEVNGLYDFDGDLGHLFRVFGAGPFWLKAKGISIAVEVMIVSDVDKGFYLQDIDINVKLQGLENNFENLMDDPELGDLMNKVIGHVAPEAVDELWPDMKGPIEKIALLVINEILKDLLINNTLGRLLNIFNYNTG